MRRSEVREGDDASVFGLNELTADPSTFRRSPGPCLGLRSGPGPRPGLGPGLGPVVLCRSWRKDSSATSRAPTEVRGRSWLGQFRIRDVSRPSAVAPCAGVSRLTSSRRSSIHVTLVRLTHLRQAFSSHAYAFVDLGASPVLPSGRPIVVGLQQRDLKAPVDPSRFCAVGPL